MQTKPYILHVDPDPAHLKDLEDMVRTLDAGLIHAPSASQAIELAQQHDLCAVLISLGLPGRDALTLTRRLCQQPAAPPVLLLFPAYPDQTACQEGYEAGASDLLFQALIPSVLPGKLKHYITLHQRQQSQALFDWLSRSMEQIALALAASLNMVEVPNMVLEQLPEVIPYERGSILLRDGDTLRIVAQRGFPPGWPVSDARIPIRQGDVFQQIVETRQPLLIDDVMLTSAWLQADGLPINHSWLGVPLVSKDHVIGMVSLTRRDIAAFEPEEISFIRASASQAAVALVNARLLNHLKEFNEQLEALVEQRTEELRRAYDRLEKIDQTKTTFISVAAHELRTPLTLIQGYASLMRSEMNSSTHDLELVDGILAGGKRLLEIVNNLIDVSLIDQQILDLHRTQVTLWMVIKIVRTEFRDTLIERNINLSICGVQELPPLLGDAELLGKLFRQLLGNAIKYTPDGGKITIEGRLVSGQEDGQHGMVEVLVRDTGIGIDEAYRELIFEKFYQMGSVELHSSGKTKFKGGGPGLGLSIARGIARAHGGNIWVESPGHNENTLPGSCFHVMLSLS